VEIMATERTLTTTATTTSLDGRRLRRERGRQAVLDATVDLIQELRRPPTSEEVAARAGVSVASLFRYFDGLADLRDQAHARFFERYDHLFQIPALGDGPLDDRIDALVTARIVLYSTIEPSSRLTRTKVLDQPQAAAALHMVRGRLADQCRAQFAPELAALTPAARDDLVGVVASLTSFESWDHLQELGRTTKQVQRAWCAALRSLLDT
jgi:AcrR family transcriptional regulator